MATGPVSPTTWVSGTVAPVSWFQGVTDNVNNWCNTNSRSIWLPASGATQNTAGQWTAFNYADMNSSAGSQILVFELSSFLPFGSGTNTATITSITARILPAGVSAMTLGLYKMINMSNTNAPVVSQIGSNASSSGATEQSITVTQSVSPTSDQQIFALVTSGQGTDRVHGLKVTYTIPVF